MNRIIVTLREVEVYRNDYVTVYDDEVQWPSGQQGTYTRIAPNGANEGVVLVPRRGDRYGVVRTYRYPLATYQWGFPRGFSQGDDVLASAAGELWEELGARPRTMEVIGHLTPDSGLQTSRVAVVLVTVDKAGSAQDTDEVDAIAWLTHADLEGRIAQAQIEDAYTLAALTLLRIHNEPN